MLTLIFKWNATLVRRRGPQRKARGPVKGNEKEGNLFPVKVCSVGTRFAYLAARSSVSLKAVDDDALGTLTGISVAGNGQALHAASICPGLTL